MDTEITNTSINNKTMLTNDQKKFIGLTLSGTGLVLFLLSLVFGIVLLFIIKFNFKVLLEAASAGYIMVGVPLALFVVGILSLAVGTNIVSKNN